jgi:hypothetical protein
MAGKKALLVGINNFKNFPTAALRGCVNDANDMAKLLKEHYGFNEGDITILTDAKATKAAIMKHLNQMVAGAKAGNLSYLLFSLSSHGTQITDTSGDESDKADEAFCPYDLATKGGAWDPKFIIIDDELHDLFVQLPDSATLECFFDTCHSGTGIKDLDPIELLNPFAPKPRYLPPPDHEPFQNEPQPKSLGTKLKEETLMGKQHILWAGCRADQTSADAFFDGRANGAFTYNYIKIVRADPKLSRKQIATKMRSALKKGKFDQIPQLETDATNRNRAAG